MKADSTFTAIGTVQALFIGAIVLFSTGLIFHAMPSAHWYQLISTFVAIIAAVCLVRYRLPNWAIWAVATAASGCSTLMLYHLVSQMDLTAALTSAPADGIAGLLLGYATRRTSVSSHRP